MFASHAAAAIANARRLQSEQRAKSDLETLIDTSPVGVVVFDARTGSPVSLNMEGRRIVDGLRNPDQTAEQLLDVLTFRRADGREISLREFPLAQAPQHGRDGAGPRRSSSASPTEEASPCCSTQRPSVQRMGRSSRWSSPYRT